MSRHVEDFLCVALFGALFFVGFALFGGAA